MHHNILDQLRKQVQEMEEKSCVLMRVRGKDVKVVYMGNLDKPHGNSGTTWVSAIPLIEYVEEDTDALRKKNLDLQARTEIDSDYAGEWLDLAREYDKIGLHANAARCLERYEHYKAGES